MGSKLRELESLGVDGRHWETSGDTTSGCWKGLEKSGVDGRHWKTPGVVEVVVVHSPTNHLGHEVGLTAEQPEGVYDALDWEHDHQDLWVAEQE